MDERTYYLVTGANRGIGLGLTAALLLRSKSLVVATTRSESTPTDELSSLPKHPTSSLLITTFDNTSDCPETLTASLTSNNVPQLDVVIANAGSGTTFESSLHTSIGELRENFEINTLGPVKLFQAAYSFLKKSKGPKFVLVSSSLGSIGDMEGACPSLAYGVSKAGANYFVRKVQFEEGWLVGLAVHPGWVRTANGQAFADTMGVEAPPMTLEESVKGVLGQIDRAKKDTISGTFVSYDGANIAW